MHHIRGERNSWHDVTEYIPPRQDRRLSAGRSCKRVAHTWCVIQNADRLVLLRTKERDRSRRTVVPVGTRSDIMATRWNAELPGSAVQFDHGREIVPIGDKAQPRSMCSRERD